VCGLVGFTRDRTQLAEADAAIVRRMLAPIAYRGPDAESVHVRGAIAVGHLRLAVVDLAGGRQPRVDDATGDALIFNGEIYGYKALAAQLSSAGVELLDQSDTEVLFRLLQRNGVPATLEKIDGMFAFAFFEGRTGKLHLVRDRFGEKPLYYAERDGTLIFASEPRAVLSHPLARALPVNASAIATYLAFEYLPGTRSLRTGLCKLAAGHRLIFMPGGRAETVCYWRPDPDESGAARTNENEAARLERLETLLDSAVRDRLVADVPVGVFLSGGVDSSLIAAYVAKHTPGLTAFTVSMPQENYDEAPAAMALANSLGLDHEVITLDDAALLQAFDSVTARMDEPLADSSLLATWIVSRAARSRVTVALGGDGADELFAGYINFPTNRLASLLARVPPAAGRALRALLSAIPHDNSYMSTDFLLRQISLGFGVDPSRQWAACMAPFAQEELNRLWQPDARVVPDDPIGESLQARGEKPWSTSELSYLFATTYLPEDILQKVDRASMYVSLEVRTPFLGRAFAEYALSLPGRDKLNGFKTKHLLKKLALRHLPRETVERKKHGFAIPLGRLLRGRLREAVGEALLGQASLLRQWFQRDMIEDLWTQHQSGTRDHRKKIWTLFCLSTALTNTASVS
jgi:asparagine synthase (glutamine-hydrolysing)